MPRSSGDRYARARRCQNSTGAHTPLRRGACGPFGQRRRIPTHPRKGGAPRAEPRCAAFGASLRVLPRSRRRAGVQQQHQKAGRRYRRGVARANLVQVCGNRNRFKGFPIMLHDGTVVPAERSSARLASSAITLTSMPVRLQARSRSPFELGKPRARALGLAGDRS
jgi:hypothetical protein